MSKLTRIWIAVAVALSAGGAQHAHADVWDVNTQNDNSAATTENELMHGSDQLHDLAGVGSTADLDFYRIGQRPQSSWEIVVDSTSGDVNSLTAGITVQRISSGGAVIQSAVPVTSTLNFNQSLRWQNTTTSVVSNETIKVFSSSCTSNCGSDDVYRIRALETTHSASRFNNAGGQSTVVFVQNTSPYAISGTMFFWNDTGAIVASYAFTVQPKALARGDTTTVPASAGQSGSVTITHNGRYGDVAGKAVTLEPATGFAFDTPLVHRAK